MGGIARLWSGLPSRCTRAKLRRLKHCHMPVLTEIPGTRTCHVLEKIGRSYAFMLGVQGCLWCRLLIYSITRQPLCGCLMSMPSSQFALRTHMSREAKMKQQQHVKATGAGSLAALVSPGHRWQCMTCMTGMHCTQICSNDVRYRKPCQAS